MSPTPTPCAVLTASADDVRALLWSTGLTREQLAAALARDVRTLDQWARGRPLPYLARVLLEIFAGRMPWRGFEGYRVQGDAIVPPGAAAGVPVAQLGVLPYQLRRLELLEREVKALREAPAQYLLDLAPS